MSKNRVDVMVDGQVITLVSEETEGYLLQVANYIDKKLSEIKSAKSSRPISESVKTMHIAANIADDYFKTLHSKQLLEEAHEAYILEMSRIQEENMDFQDKLNEMQKQLDIALEQFREEAAEMTKEIGELEAKILSLEADKQDFEDLKKEYELLTEINNDLEEQLSQARSDLEEYISTFDEDGEHQNVVTFTRINGGHDYAE